MDDELFKNVDPNKREEIKNKVLNDCWEYLNKEPELILDNFIIYTNSEYTYRIPPQGMSQVKFLDYIIHYFQEKEEFEKCAHLLKIKKKILGNKRKRKR